MRNLINFFKKLGLPAVILLCILSRNVFSASGAPGWVHAVYNPAENGNSVTWAPVDLGDVEYVFYDVQRKIGNPYSVMPWEDIGTVLSDTELLDSSLQVQNLHTDYSYRVTAYFPGPRLSTCPWSGTACSYFIHDLKRGGYGDYEESQLCYGPLWKVWYQMQKDEFVTIRVYPSTTTITGRTCYGMPTGYNKPPIRTIIKYTPRSEELLESVWWNEEDWDCRDDTGTVVDNGIYLLTIDAFDCHIVHDTDSVSGLNSRVGNRMLTLPVDVVRILDFYTNTLTGNQSMGVFHYKITAGAEVKIKVYPAGTTFQTVVDTNPASAAFGEPIASASPLRTLVYYRGDGEHTDEWDGTDDSGLPLDNGIYPIAIMAKNDDNRVAFNEDGNDHPIYTYVTLDRAILRLSDFTADTLTSYSSEKIFTYTISNPATVKIKIYPQGTVLGSEISQTTGEPVTSTAALKTLTYFKTAGTYEAYYDGTDDAGNFLLDGLYTTAVMAKDDYGRVAKDENGNYRPVWTKMAISRSDESDDTPEDATGPVVQLSLPSAGSVLSKPPSSIVINLSDASAINWTKTTVSVKNPAGQSISGTVQHDENNFVFWPAAIGGNGIYTVETTAVDIYGFSTVQTFSFTVNNTLAGFTSENVSSGPNPGPDSSGNITFRWEGGESAVISIYNIMGELVEKITNAISGQTWNCTNSEGKAAPGLYVYRIKSAAGQEVVKKLFIKR
ncbi:MAG: T9SS type A sorting domain-containing protein [bacterium]